MAYMRTLLSQLEAARWSDLGLNRMSDMLSVGGLVTGLSPDRSPWVGFELAEEVLDAVPKRPAIGRSVCGVVESGSREVVGLMRLA